MVVPSKHKTVEMQNQYKGTKSLLQQLEGGMFALMRSPTTFCCTHNDKQQDTTQTSTVETNHA
jgi:hypothetical protein